MRLVTDNEVEELVRMNRSRAVDDRLTEYTREQARETVAALTELLTHRRGVPVEGVVREGRMEAV